MTCPYRVSKFDPAASVAERRGDWTSISDVGRRFSGRTLTRAMYEEVESRYLDAARLALAEAEVKELRLKDVVRSSIATSNIRWIAEGISVDVEQAVAVCRAELREQVSCRLLSDSGFSIDIGFDFYLYITSPTPLQLSLQEIGRLGLHVERGVPSPYFTQ